ncbi:MAG: hypothetical protein IKZ88_08680 [Neisseriaceae bacterium]|nr:hypothetical protein [Neisseriaceae bacterium]
MKKLQGAIKQFIISIAIMFGFFYIANVLFQNTATPQVQKLDKKENKTPKKQDDKNSKKSQQFTLCKNGKCKCYNKLSAKEETCAK